MVLANSRLGLITGLIPGRNIKGVAHECLECRSEVTPRGGSGPLRISHWASHEPWLESVILSLGCLLESLGSRYPSPTTDSLKKKKSPEA